MSKATRLAWIFGSTLAVFALWLATDGSANAGIGFFYVVPIGLAAWWGGGPLRDDLCLLTLRSEPEAAASAGGR